MDVILTASLVLSLHASVCTADAAEEVVWHDASTLTVEGRGWSSAPGPFCRFPEHAREKVPEPVWDLSNHSAGILIRFVSNAGEMRARWGLANANLAMLHMPATGVSGLDLYMKHKGSWRWLGIGRPQAQESEAVLVSGLRSEDHEFALYLPLYNGTTKLEIGVPAGAKLQPAPSRAAAKPIVFYGTSITQGGCASRPGMAYPAIVGRTLDVPVINLGFSGNGRCEHEVADLLAELDPSVYVIDPLPNMSEFTVEDHIGYLLKALRAKHPETPVVLVESITYRNSFAMAGGPGREAKSNRKLRELYKEAADDWGGRLYYAKGERLLGVDGEGTVDGVHPTDLGFLRMADALTPVIRKALAR